jgi:predicted transcriptional regulator of viral defense system
MSLSSYIKEVRQFGARHFTLKKLMADRGLSKNAALNAIHRIKGRGELISPVRGLYVIVPPEHKPHGCIPVEELSPIMMKYLNAEYYVVLLSAASCYGAIRCTHLTSPATSPEVEVQTFAIRAA